MCPGEWKKQIPPRIFDIIIDGYDFRSTDRKYDFFDLSMRDITSTVTFFFSSPILFRGNEKTSSRVYLKTLACDIRYRIKATLKKYTVTMSLSI